MSKEERKWAEREERPVRRESAIIASCKRVWDIASRHECRLESGHDGPHECFCGVKEDGTVDPLNSTEDVRYAASGGINWRNPLDLLRNRIRG